MSTIVNKAPHSNSNVYYYQVDLLALLTRELLAVYERNREITLDSWFALPEYMRFLKGAYACGFVCSNFSLMDDFLEYQNRPDEHIRTASWTQFRHYIHTLLRGEKWADGYSSPILDAAKSGALTVVLERLERPDTLKDVILIDLEDIEPIPANP